MPADMNDYFKKKKPSSNSTDNNNIGGGGGRTLKTHSIIWVKVHLGCLSS